MRLKIVSYAVLGLFLATSGLGLAYYIKTLHQDRVIENLAGRVVQAEGQLGTAMDSLDEIERSVQASDAIIGTLHEALATIAASDGAIGERIEMLERNNVEIRDLLSTRLPDGGCLLDNSCSHSAVSLHRPKPSPVDPVRPSEDRTK